MSEKIEVQHIELGDIIINEQLQMRADLIDWDFVETLADRLREGKSLEPIVLFRCLNDPTYGGTVYRTADGHHRFNAYMAVGAVSIPAVVHEGGFTEAFKYALGANADQRAKPRTRKDIRKAVIAAIEQLILGAPKAERATQQEVAELCKTTQQTVGNIYRELTAKPKPKGDDEATQTDFFAALNRDWAGIPKTFGGILQRPYWIDAAIPLQQRLEGVDTLISSFNKLLEDAKEHKARLLGK